MKGRGPAALPFELRRRRPAAKRCDAMRRDVTRRQLGGARFATEARSLFAFQCIGSIPPTIGPDGVASSRQLTKFEVDARLRDVPPAFFGLLRVVGDAR